VASSKTERLDIAFSLSTSEPIFYFKLLRACFNFATKVEFTLTNVVSYFHSFLVLLLLPPEDRTEENIIGSGSSFRGLLSLLKYIWCEEISTMEVSGDY
jgi:hypothetical protein